jgi:ABC-type dipeptide/oligopeptide/nickel transport system ATPase component
MSLNPTKKIASQIIEAIKITEYRKYQHNLYILQNQTPKLSTDEINEKKILLKKYYKQKTDIKSMTQKMQEVLEFIGISDYEKTVNSYPHEFSGGMRQRIVIAITIVGEPDVIIADEPTTALDVTIQAKVLDLIKKLSIKYSVAVIFISHDISLIANFCNYIYIMYAGMIVERGRVTDIFTNPVHPYT